jgi:hypothetical protein
VVTNRIEFCSRRTPPLAVVLMPALAIVLVCAVMILGACAKTTASTPAAPTPPQVVVANAIATFSQANDAAVHSVIAARNAGTVSPADAATVESASATAANAVLALNSELTSTTDVWCATNVTGFGCQQGKMIQILQNLGLAQLAAHVSANTQLLVAAILTSANAVSAALGGPQL